MHEKAKRLGVITSITVRIMLVFAVFYSTYHIHSLNQLVAKNSVRIEFLEEVNVDQEANLLEMDLEMDMLQQAIDNHMNLIEVSDDYYIVGACDTESTFKSYMHYGYITDSSSKQWVLQQSATTGSDGIRYVADRMMVAMAGYEVGLNIDVIFDNGIEIPVIIGDVKGSTNCKHPDGSILEVIVDHNLMDQKVRYDGSYDSIFPGSIKELRIYKMTKNMEE